MAAGLRDLELTGNSDWIEPQLWIVRHEIVERGDWLAIGCAARHAGRALGFKLMYPLIWHPAREEAPVKSLAAFVCFFEARPHSDAFIQTLASLWGVEPPEKMARKAEFWAMQYDGHPAKVLSERVNLLVAVGQPDNTSTYGQMHLVVDMAAGYVRIGEREPDYPPFRQAIIHALSSG